MQSYTKLKAKYLKNRKVEKAYDALRVEFTVIESLIRKRKKPQCTRYSSLFA